MPTCGTLTDDRAYLIWKCNKNYRALKFRFSYQKHRGLKKDNGWRRVPLTPRRKTTPQFERNRRRQLLRNQRNQRHEATTSCKRHLNGKQRTPATAIHLSRFPLSPRARDGMQAQCPRPEDRVPGGSATAAAPPVQPATATMSTTNARTKRSASMPLHGTGASASAGAGKGRDPSPTPGPGGRARLRGEQLRQLQELFLRFDLDGDGSLTKLELAALLRSLGLRPAAGDEIHALIAAMDADGNGTVEFDELASSLAPLLLGPCRPAVAVDHAQLAEAFRAFDRDGNGFISAAELARSMALMGHPICYAELTDMMKEADTDGDGVISFQEFTAIMAKSAVDFLGLAAL
ncbi:probable calcium-binding protein CML12 [Sorghum bicolor]|nr:probable calcium-binding protein CML12 [Sorghum bicolor]|eukprot:XP_002458119.2 probable calcium-binding protein CML12 [Sorghum bicolor]